MLITVAVLLARLAVKLPPTRAVEVVGGAMKRVKFKTKVEFCSEEIRDNTS